MDTPAIIEDYVNRVAASLPRARRHDIGWELQALLTEQLSAAAAAAGRAPDPDMAMEVLQRFGQPHDVAARYAPRGFELVAPEYSPMVVALGALCVAVQWTATLPAVFSARMTPADWWWGRGVGAFWWVGALVTWFAMASWIQRRWPADPASGRRPWMHWIVWVPFPREWRPGAPEREEWQAAVNAAPLGAALTLFFIAPASVLGWLLPAGVSASWAQYDEPFQRWLLLPLISLMAVRLLLLAAAAVNARRRARTAALRFALWIAFTVLLSWAAFTGPIFAHVVTDTLFKGWLLIFLLVNVLQILVWIRRADTRVRMPHTLVTRP